MNARPARLIALTTMAAALAVSACAPSQNGSDGGDAGGGAGGNDATNESAGATGDDAAGGEASGDPVKVAIIYSETGPLAAYGQQFSVLRHSPPARSVPITL